jgi:trehalose 6-phosphate synthase
MDIVSYRGPGKGGGVSPALSGIWRKYAPAHALWWHLEGSKVVHERAGAQARPVGEIPAELVAGHYRYCNDFLWPVMHDLPQFAKYSPADRHLYRQFNWALAFNIASIRSRVNPIFFIQDYQLSYLPQYFHDGFKLDSMVFWHIPWPRQVSCAQLNMVAEVAAGMLLARVIGFHTSEYVCNFVSFVKQHLRRSYERLLAGDVELLVCPLGIDQQYWEKMAVGSQEISLPECELVLSVDRADYTKGVLERLAAIDLLFENNRQLLGKVSFVQVSARTRPGLSAFDSYWSKCLASAQRLMDKWSLPDWSPLVWLTEPLSNEQLASLYRRAEYMLVNPLRDGLNLTAKEFVACRSHAHPGVLMLSPEAGAWQELKGAALAVNPFSPEQMSRQLMLALTMSADERQARAHLARQKLAGNSLESWWRTFEHTDLQKSVLPWRRRVAS